MIQSETLLQVIKQLLNAATPKNLNADRIATQLSALEESQNVPLSAYGYVMYFLEHAGMGGIYHGRLSDPKLMEDYALLAKKYKEDLPVLLVNAKEYAEKVIQVVQDPDLIIMRLEGMSFPYVLFILFTVLRQPAMVEQYRTETTELLKRYPGTLMQLPENIQTLVQEELNADTE